MTSVNIKGYLLEVKLRRSLGRSIRLIMTDSGLMDREGSKV